MRRLLLWRRATHRTKRIDGRGVLGRAREVRKHVDEGYAGSGG